MPLPILCITLTNDLPGSINIRLKILGMFIPTLATPYVAINTLFVASLISSYCSFLSANFVSPLTKTLSLINSCNFSPAVILSTKTKVFPPVDILSTSLETYVTLASSVTRNFNSS